MEEESVKETIQEIAERAMALGMTDEYIDADCVVYVANGNVFVNLGNYIKFICEDSKVILPDGIYGVFLTNFYSVLDHRKSYRFIFPESLCYVGENYDSYVLNSVNFTFESAPLYNTMDKLKNCIFDFTACKNIKYILPNAFTNKYIKGLYFGDIDEVRVTAFRDASIEKLKFKSLKKVKVSAFLDADVKECDLGTEIEVVENSGLCFDQGPDVLILNHLKALTIKSISGIGKVYLKYDLGRYTKAAIASVETLLEDLKKFNSHYYTMQALKDFCEEEIWDTSREGYYERIQDNLSSYYGSTTDIKLDTFLLTLSMFFYTSNNDSRCHLYLYDKTKNTGIKSRKYYKLGSFSQYLGNIGLHIDINFLGQ